MRGFSKRRTTLILLPLVLAGCATSPDRAQYKGPDAGFSTVSAKTSEAIAKETAWIQSQDEADRLSDSVHEMVYKKTIDADTAVQVALLNNKGLQAAYAEVGMSSAEAWQQTLLENPTISIGIFGIGAPDLGLFRSIEGTIANNILAIMTREQRVDIADTRFRQAQMNAALETLTLAAETRRAWIDAVAAFEQVAYLNKALTAADAASEFAEQLGTTGALGRRDQAREHVFYAELAGQSAEARLAAKGAKEELTRLMGLWGEDVDFFVPDALPPVPNRADKTNVDEKEALRRRVDLQIARLELEAIAKSYGLTEATRYLTDFEIIAGFESEREFEDGDRDTVTTAQIEFEFAIPIFDSGEARMRKAEVAYMQAANRLAEKAVNIRSEARSAYTRYRSTHDIVHHYERNVLPLYATIEEQALLFNNGMITSTFELLADTRASIGGQLQFANAKKEFWLADANLSATISGGGASSGGGESAPASVADSGGGH